MWMYLSETVWANYKKDKNMMIELGKYKLTLMYLFKECQIKTLEKASYLSRISQKYIFIFHIYSFYSKILIIHINEYY